MKLNGIKGMGGRSWLAAVVGVLGIIGGTREQVWANDIAYRDVIRRTDYIAAGVGGLRNVGSGTITLRGMNGKVHRALLYWAGPSNSTNESANASITFNGRSIEGAPCGLTSDNGWGFDHSQAYRADVTDIVALKGDGAYVIAGALKQGTNINANGASLLVFFNDANLANDRDIVLFDGNDSNTPNPHDMLGWNVRLNDIRYTNGTAYMQLHVSDGQAYKDGSIMVNGRTIVAAGPIFQGTSLPSANNGPINNGDLWDIRSINVTTFLQANPNALRLTHKLLQPAGDSVSLIVAAINLPAGAAPPNGPELTNNAPSVIAEPEMTVYTPDPVVLHAEVTDIDGDALTTAISMDGLLVKTGAIARTMPVTSGTLSITNAFSLGEHTIVFAASDGRLGADATTLLRVVDNIPPVLNLPPNIVTPADPGKDTAVVTYTVTATDNFPGEINIVCLPLAGSAFPLGVTTVNCTATDVSGNVGRGSFTITVTDNQPPSITCPPHIIHPAAPGTNVAVVHFTVTATDNAPGVTVACVPPSGSLFPMRTTPVTCVARDAAGNSASCSFNVTVTDGEPPIFDMPPMIIVGNDTGRCNAAVNYEGKVHVIDNMPGVTLTCAPPSGTVFPLGTNIVRCTARDSAGNTASNSFLVIVVDTEKPVLALPADIVVPCGCAASRSGCCKPGSHKNTVTYRVPATDNCSAAPVTCTPPSGSAFAIGTNTVRCTARDASGNTATGSFKVIVQDTQPPVIRCIRLSKTCLWPANHKMVPVCVYVTATDNCGRVTSRIVSVTSNQADSGLDSTDVPNDWQITGALTVNLRAERIPASSTRRYTLRIETKDTAGNVTYGTAVVSVKSSSSRDDD